MRGQRISVTALTVMLMVFACSSGNDYGEAVDVNTRFVDAMETYMQGIDGADSASAVVDAIDAYAEEIEKLAPEIKALAAKHPEWKDIGKVPEELRPVQERAAALAAQIPATFMKTMKYMRDAEVQEAHKRLQAAMARMQ